jgi:hypothetical protein
LPLFFPFFLNNMGSFSSKNVNGKDLSSSELRTIVDQIALISHLGGQESMLNNPDSQIHLLQFALKVREGEDVCVRLICWLKRFKKNLSVLPLNGQFLA